MTLETPLNGVLVLFDLDLTLIDSRRAIAASVNRVLEQMRRPPVSEQSVYDKVGFPLEDFFDTLETAEEVQRACTAYRVDFAKSFHQDVFLFPNAKNMLERLRAAGARLGICTNKRKDMAKLVLEHFALMSLFDAIVSADDFAPKPNPASVFYLIDNFKAKRNAVFVGDSIIDVQTAQNAAIPCILVNENLGPLGSNASNYSRLTRLKSVGQLDEKIVLNALSMQLP